jgi:hypothetical protein
LEKEKLAPVRGPLTVTFGRCDVRIDGARAIDQMTKLAADKSNARAERAAETLAGLKRGEKLPEHYNCPIAVWQFGQDLTLVGLSGEVVVDYLTFVEKALGPNRLWVAAYCNDVFGYLPSARVLAEGGYETGGLRGIPFHPDAEKAVLKTVRELAVKAGRKMPE